MKKIKHISSKYIDLIPEYLKSPAYDEYQDSYSARRLSIEIHKRQMLYLEIIEFQKFCRHPEIDNRSNKKFFPGISLSIFFNKYKQSLPSSRELTITEKIEIEKSYYEERLQKISKSFTKLISPEESPQLINKKDWDSRPYITPVRNTNDRLQKRYDLSYDEFRLLIKSKQYKQTDYSFSINLNFSNHAIIEEFKQHLKFLRQITEHKAIFNKPKEFIEKIKQYKIIQSMDLLIWAKLNDHTLEIKMFEQLLFPNGGFESDRVNETILPLATSLLDSKSTDSQYLIYLADQKFQQKVGKVIS